MAPHRLYWCDVFIFHGGHGWTRRGIKENENDNDVFHTEGADGSPQADGGGGISIKDDSLGIEWRLPTANAILSEKDTKHKLLNDFVAPVDINTNLYPEVE